MKHVRYRCLKEYVYGPIEIVLYIFTNIRKLYKILVLSYKT